MRIPLVVTLSCAALVTGLALAAPPPKSVEPMSRAAAPAPAPAGALTHPVDNGAPEVQELERQIKALKDEVHGQLDPLEAQIKDLKTRYEPRLQSLETQRHDLVESRKSPAIQDLDRQEAAELASLAEREKTDLDKLRASYADQRKAVQAKYQQLRDQAKTATR